METPLAVQVPVQLDSAGRIDQDTTCVCCGYNLRGLSLEGACPECATPIGRSFQGEFLCYAPPVWVETLASGMNWIVVAIIIGVVLGTLSSFAGRAVGKPGLGQLVCQLLGIISVVGYWKFATPDPAQLEQELPLNARKLVRLTEVFNYVLSCALSFRYFDIGKIDTGLVVVLMLVGGLSSIVGYFAVFIYARQLALRIPDFRLAGQTRIVMWGMVVTVALAAFTTVGELAAVRSGQLPGALWVAPMCAMALGALVFGIWSLILVVWFRRELITAASQARRTWARPTGTASAGSALQS